jgi:hypothetical protein
MFPYGTPQPDRFASQKGVVFVPRHHARWNETRSGQGTGTAEQGSDTAHPGRYERSHETKDMNVQGQESERNTSEVMQKVIEKLIVWCEKSIK